MTSDLNQRQGSKILNMIQYLNLSLFVVLCLAIMAFVAEAAVQPVSPVLEIPSGYEPNLKEADWIMEDRLWLGQFTTLGPEFPDRSIPADSLASLKNILNISTHAPADSTAGARQISSLLRDRWLQRGYFSATVHALRSQTQPVTKDSKPDTLLLHPGPPYRLKKLDVSGDDFPGKIHLLQTWMPRPGDIFIPKEFDGGINRVLEGAGESGFPFVRWSTSKLTLDPTTATLEIKAALLPGTKSYLGAITCDLPNGRGQNFLLKATGLSSGQRFQNSQLERARQRLWARDLYLQVDMPTVYTTTAKDTVGIHFSVEPRLRANHLQVVLGLSRPADDSGTKLSGEVDLRLPNMSGTGRALQIGWRDDGVNKSRFGFTYLEPLAFGTPLDTDITLNHEVQKESFTLFSLDNRWRLQVVNLWGVELGGGWDRSTYPDGVWVSSTRTRARGAFFHRRGDRTRSGWTGLFAIENAWRSSIGRLDDDQGDGSLPNASKLGESITQQIYEVDSSGEFFLGNGWSLYGRGSLRELSGSEGDVPLSEQFQFGGASSLRGYREDEFHGSRAAWASLEVRIGRPGGSRLYSFYDVGYFAFSIDDPIFEDPDVRLLKEGWPKGFGLGILAKTPGGNISLAIGFPGTVDFDLAKLHVTLLESF